MKSASTKHGGKPAPPAVKPRTGDSPSRAGESQLRVRERPPASERREGGSNVRPLRDPNAAHGGDEPRTGVVRRVESSWRCLEWEASATPRPRRRPRPKASKVTIVQLSAEGDLIRQNGPDSWLPEAGDFMQRMSTLLARSLGFEGCRSLCLRSESAVLAVSAVGSSRVVAVSGPTRSMANVLRRVGLE